jgi:hypothetical protein
MRTWFGLTMALALGFGAGPLVGCGDDTSFQPASRGRRGEACQSRNDCEAGLACLGGGGGGICGIENYDVAANANVCRAVQCDIGGDCCELDPATCEFGAGFSCDAGRCVPRCDDDTDCAFGFCVSDTCVECRTTDDCFNEDETCQSGECRGPECEQDGDCFVRGNPLTAFNVCESNQCVTGECETDRQCQVALEDPLAVCLDPGEGMLRTCSVPCEVDADCFFGAFQACVGGRCQYIGCDDDLECGAQCLNNPGVCVNGGVSDVLRFVCEPGADATPAPPSGGDDDDDDGGER